MTVIKAQPFSIISKISTLNDAKLLGLNIIGMYGGGAAAPFRRSQASHRFPAMQGERSKGIRAKR
jgi:hypothetical protein